jgi:hypothetical protein
LVDQRAELKQRHKQEAQLETLDNKLARLRGELQQAYSAWLLENGRTESGPGAHAAVCASDSHTRWAVYLAAKQRLVAAYAEEAPAI